MTNRQIIAQAMEKAGLNPVNTKVDTFAGWKRQRYRVKSGENASFKTKIWKPVNSNKSEEDEEKLILVNAAFFTMEQVEKE